MPKDISDKLTAEFKKNLKAILEERKGKTNPKKLSVDAGLGETAIRDILQNRSASPKLDTIHKIAGALNVPVYRLIPSMIDQSYEELAKLREENRILREAVGEGFEDMDTLKKAAKARSNKK
ncbi:MAG: helix-turn-helix domain-containing protein [Alphaproteobacteria bacterium]